MKILLINDNSAHANWGAQASPPSLVSILNGAMPGSSIQSLPHSWLRLSYRRLWSGLGGGLVRSEGSAVMAPVVRRCSRPVSFFPEVADEFDYWADEWTEGRGGPQAKTFLDLARAADVVVYNGENSIYRNTMEGCHGIFLLWLTRTRLGKTSCIVNHTAQLNDVRPIMNGMIRLVYPALDLVAVREPCSLENLRALGCLGAELYPDVVFSQEPRTRSRRRVDGWRASLKLRDESYFCISASGLPVSMPRGRWDGEVTQLVRGLKASGLQAVLVAKDPWCLPLEEVARRTGSIFFGPEHEYEDLWPLFEGASFLVSGHYHYVIFAAMVGCPFIPLSVNNHKMRGVCEHLGWKRSEPFDATLLRLCRNEIVEEALELARQRPRLSAHLRERTAVLQHEARRLGTRVAEVARGSVNAANRPEAEPS